MSTLTVEAMQKFKLPKGVRWMAGGILPMTYHGRRMVVGTLTHDSIGPKSRRSFADVVVSLDATEDEIAQKIAAAITEMVQKAQVH